MPSLQALTFCWAPWVILGVGASIKLTGVSHKLKRSLSSLIMMRITDLVAMLPDIDSIDVCSKLFSFHFVLAAFAQETFQELFAVY